MKISLKSLSKRTLAAVLGAAMLTGCSAAGSTNSGEVAKTDGKAITIKVGTVVAATHPMNVALKETFKPMVEEKSGGKIKVEIYEGGVLGGEKELWDSVRNGNVEMTAIGTVMWNEVDKMSIPDWPFLFRDLEHAKKVYTGEIGEEMAKAVEEKAGVHFMSWHPNGVRVFSSNKTISSLDTFKGMRLRMPNNPIHIQVGKLLGANVTPLPLGEVFTALEQKVVDGQDNPLSTFRNEGWFEVQTDIFESNHMVASLELIASDKLMKSLSEDQQKIIEEASLKTSEESWKLYANSLEADKKFLQENGIKFTTPSDADRAKLIEIVQPVYDELYTKYPWAKEMVEKIRNVK
ncbi:TRAP transporter substrate-binding protein [Clostridium sp.]|uniref:TRAP transporter substrate-binding protein n=1 Tax=Clostridium sp. TaxID=1506 RepID=UPI002FCAD5F9